MRRDKTITLTAEVRTDGKRFEDDEEEDRASKPPATIATSMALLALITALFNKPQSISINRSLKKTSLGVMGQVALAYPTACEGWGFDGAAAAVASAAGASSADDEDDESSEIVEVAVVAVVGTVVDDNGCCGGAVADIRTLLLPPVDPATGIIGAVVIAGATLFFGFGGRVLMAAGTVAAALPRPAAGAAGHALPGLLLPDPAALLELVLFFQGLPAVVVLVLLPTPISRASSADAFAPPRVGKLFSLFNAGLVPLVLLMPPGRLLGKPLAAATIVVAPLAPPLIAAAVKRLALLCSLDTLVRL
jgi:hypothetical protein